MQFIIETVFLSIVFIYKGILVYVTRHTCQPLCNTTSTYPLWALYHFICFQLHANPCILSSGDNKENYYAIPPHMFSSALLISPHQLSITLCTPYIDDNIHTYSMQYHPPISQTFLPCLNVYELSVHPNRRSSRENRKIYIMQYYNSQWLIYGALAHSAPPGLPVNGLLAFSPTVRDQGSLTCQKLPSLDITPPGLTRITFGEKISPVKPKIQGFLYASCLNFTGQGRDAVEPLGH